MWTRGVVSWRKPGRDAEGSKTNEVLTLKKKLVLALKGVGMRFNVSMSLT